MIRIRNVHARRFVASIDRIGALIDSLAAEHDDLWPRDWWPPIRLDGPLRVGARGGHARVRHFVEDYFAPQPGVMSGPGAGQATYDPANPRGGLILSQFNWRAYPEVFQIWQTGRRIVPEK